MLWIKFNVLIIDFIFQFFNDYVSKTKLNMSIICKEKFKNIHTWLYEILH